MATLGFKVNDSIVILKIIMRDLHETLWLLRAIMRDWQCGMNPRAPGMACHAQNKETDKILCKYYAGIMRDPGATTCTQRLLIRASLGLTPGAHLSLKLTSGSDAASSSAPELWSSDFEGPAELSSVLERGEATAQ